MDQSPDKPNDPQTSGEFDVGVQNGLETQTMQEGQALLSQADPVPTPSASTQVRT